MNQYLPIMLSFFLYNLHSAAVQADDRGQSIMFGDTPGYQTKTPISSINDTDETCKRLAEEVELLKGKPQRRYTARKRFEAECTNRYSDE